MFNILRRIKNSISNRKMKNIFFLHVPKCGGRSLENAIINQYLTLNIMNDKLLIREDSVASAKAGSILSKYEFYHGDVNDYDILEFRKWYLAYLMSKGCRLIRGHFVFDENIYKAFKEKYAFITILRDPVSKWLSNYNYRKYRSSKHWKIENTIEEYLNSDLGKVHGYDYVKYYSGPSPDNIYTNSMQINKAKENLKNFHLVGILENLSEFKKKFYDEFNCHLKIPQINKSPKKETVDKDILLEIEKICLPDIEIYNYVKKYILK